MSELKAGRELDALVAEKVLGLTKDIDGVWSSNGVKLFWPDTTYSDDDIWLPEYSGDIAAAFEVISAMQSNDWAFILDNMHGHLGNWQAHFERDESAFAAESENTCEAICLAALEAMGAK